MMSLFQMAELRAKRKNEEKLLTQLICEKTAPSAAEDGGYELNLHNLKLAFISVKPFQTISQTIVSLYMDNNELVEFPHGIFQSLVNLRNLALHNNGLRSIPSDIGELKLLRECRLDYNDLITLPDEMGNCTALELLHLSGNTHLASLPDTFGSLRNLHHILMDEVSVTALPLSMYQCCSLEFIQFEESVLIVPPAEVVAAGGAAIRSHLRSLVDAGSHRDMDDFVACTANT